MTIPIFEAALRRAFADDPQALALFDATQPNDDTAVAVDEPAPELDDARAEALERWDAAVADWQAEQHQDDEPERVLRRDWGSPRERSAPEVDNDEDMSPLMRVALTICDETVEALARQRHELLLQVDALRGEVATLRREIEALREARS